MDPDTPKLDSKAERVRFAIRKKYLSEDDWSNKEIAEELNVRPEVVSRYINQTPQAQEIQKARSEIETERWKELLVDLMRRLDKLADLEDQLWDAVEPAVTAYETVPAEANIEEYHLQQGGDSLRLDLGDAQDDDASDPPETEVEIPVPAQWEEMPQFSRLQRVWDERRRTQDQLVELLGLDAADELHVQGELTEQKVFAVDDDAYPDAEPHQRGEEPPEEEDDG